MNLCTQSEKIPQPLPSVNLEAAAQLSPSEQRPAEMENLEAVPGELWRPIRGTNRLYFVSNIGRVLVASRIARTWNGLARRRPKIMKQSPARGYPTVMISMPEIRKKIGVHRLVSEAFIPNHGNKPQVNHKDGVRDNNKVENLEWVTGSENVKHAVYVLCKGRGEDVTGCKLNRAQVIEIRAAKREGGYGTYHVKNLAAKYGVSIETIWLIIRRQSWAWLPQPPNQLDPTAENVNP